jgi:hypothetical protein
MSFPPQSLIGERRAMVAGPGPRRRQSIRTAKCAKPRFVCLAFGIVRQKGEMQQSLRRFDGPERARMRPRCSCGQNNASFRDEPSVWTKSSGTPLGFKPKGLATGLTTGKGIVVSTIGGRIEHPGARVNRPSRVFVLPKPILKYFHKSPFGNFFEKSSKESFVRSFL